MLEDVEFRDFSSECTSDSDEKGYVQSIAHPQRENDEFVTKKRWEGNDDENDERHEPVPRLSSTNGDLVRADRRDDLGVILREKNPEQRKCEKKISRRRPRKQLKLQLSLH